MCEDEYIELLEKTLKDIDTIDGDVPWREVEPEWWLQMMTLRRVVQQYLNGYNE